jgi:hypothetical protein
MPSVACVLLSAVPRASPLSSPSRRYEISDADYEKRDDNFRKWKANKLAADPTWTLAKEVKANQDKKRMASDPNYVPEPPKAAITDDEHLADIASKMSVGDRCEVTVGGKRGEVRYVGKIPAIAPGWFIGVQYDEPVGKNDGSVKGTRFFEWCALATPPPDASSVPRPPARPLARRGAQLLRRRLGPRTPPCARTRGRA